MSEIHSDTEQEADAVRSPKQFEFGKWYPIDEAPLAVMGLVTGPLWRGAFPGARNGENGAVWIDTCEAVAKGRQDYATHWMPLPPRPCFGDRDVVVEGCEFIDGRDVVVASSGGSMNHKATEG